MIILDLIYNLAVLIALSILSGFIDTRFNRAEFNGKVLQGLLFGLTAIIGMLYPFRLVEGIIFDGRSIIISLCTLFFGPVSGIISSIIAILFRLYLGGGGALVGTLVITSSFLIGYFFFIYKKKSDEKLTNLHLYVFGFIVNGVMLLLFLLLPYSNNLELLKILLPTVIGVYPVATLLIGKILLDQQEKQKFLKEIQHSEQRYRMVLENSLDAILITSPDGTVFSANPAACKMFQRSEEEICRLGSAGLADLKDPRLAKLLSEREKYGKAMGEITMYRKDGSTFQAEISSSVFTDSNGKIKSSMIIRDITEKNQMIKELIFAKEKAEEMNQLKSNFLANMSHELRTPLVGIIGYADHLRQESGNPEVRDAAETIYNSSNRLSETLNLILDLSKFEAEKQDLKSQRIDIISKTKQIVELFKESAQKKGLSLNSSFNSDSIIINFEERAFHSILNNLINNAIKFTSEGSVNVQVGQENNIAQIKVSDTGIGIDKKYHQTIFDEFRQVSEGFNRNFEGSGLGLHLTKKLIEKFGGSISVESEIGSGSTFVVKIPARYSEINTQIINPEPKSILNKNTEIDSNKPVALLIDDDPIVYQLMKRFLADYVYLESTADAEYGIKMLQEKKYDLIFMDINLKRGMDGKQATKKIRTLKEYEKTPIVAITAYAMPGDEEDFLSAGCSHYLSKPFRKADLTSLVSKIFKEELSKN